MMIPKCGWEFSKTMHPIKHNDHLEAVQRVRLEFLPTKSVGVRLGEVEASKMFKRSMEPSRYVD